MPQGPFAVLTRDAVPKLARGLKALQPALSDARATELASLLLEYSPAPWTSAAILMQESSLRDTHVFKTGYDAKARALRNVMFDMGIAQINAGTARAYKCNLQLLAAHDTREAIRCHSVVLQDKLSMCRSFGKAAYACYNSVTPVHRLAYQKAVERWLLRLQPHHPKLTRKLAAMTPPMSLNQRSPVK